MSSEAPATWVCAAQLQDAGVVLKGLALLPMAVDVEQAAKTARCGLLRYSLYNYI